MAELKSHHGDSRRPGPRCTCCSSNVITAKAFYPAFFVPLSASSAVLLWNIRAEACVKNKSCAVEAAVISFYHMCNTLREQFITVRVTPKIFRPHPSLFAICSIECCN